MYKQLGLLLLLGLFVHSASYSKGLDPTKPSQYIKDPAVSIEIDTGEPMDLNLNAIWLSKNRRQATINDQLFGEGDWVGGLEILEINSKGVVFAQGESRKLLLLDRKGAISKSYPNLKDKTEVTLNE